jgi:hypothetical protein
MEITKYFAERYPELIPSGHEDEIDRYLRDLHYINYFSLSFTAKPQVMQPITAKIHKLMGEKNSPRYRKALEYKLSVYVHVFRAALTFLCFHFVVPSFH